MEHKTQKNNFDSRFKLHASGFTLLEVLIAISILTIAFLGPVAVATRALSSSSVSTNQIIAYNLAEEGMEYMVNMRDSMIFADPNNNGGWNNFKNTVQSGQCQTANGCYIDIITGAINGCGSNPPNLRRDTISGLYNYDASDAETIFERCIFVDSGASDEKKVEVVVSWTEKAGNVRSFTLERVLFNRK